MLMVTAHAAVAATRDSSAMLLLATRSGCLTCHSIDAPAPSATATKPIGPPWREVAIKYRGQPGAVDKLTATVMMGSSPYASHWKGKVTGLAMPPNAVAIDEVRARKLVRWILSLAH